MTRGRLFQIGVQSFSEGVIGLCADEDVAVDVELGLAEDAALATAVIQFHHLFQAGGPIITSFKLRLIDAKGDGRLHIIFSICAPQVILVFKQIFVQRPEKVRVLLASAFRGERGIDAGVAVIEHWPKDELDFAGHDVIAQDVWLCA